MTAEPRKASEIIVALENKVDVLLGLVRSLDLNIKILSNKLNQLSEKSTPTIPKFTVEAVNVSPNLPTFSALQPDPERAILIDPEAQVPVAQKIDGFRRTSRPETFSGDDAYLKREDPQIKAEVIVPVPNGKVPAQERKAPPSPLSTNAVIPTTQRIVNGHGKSIYLADVEITNTETGEVKKTRTSAMGKWTAPLPIGTYSVMVRKTDTASQKEMKVIQTIRVDGKQSPFEAPQLIIN
jgi:hypothetical protein